MPGPYQASSSARLLLAISVAPARTRIQRGVGSTRAGGTSIVQLDTSAMPSTVRLDAPSATGTVLVRLGVVETGARRHPAPELVETEPLRLYAGRHRWNAGQTA